MEVYGFMPRLEPMTSDVVEREDCNECRDTGVVELFNGPVPCGKGCKP